jgi:hypothetical protein
MRSIITFVAVTAIATAAQANPGCDHEYLGSEDLAVMASVLPTQNETVAATMAQQPASRVEGSCLLPVQAKDPQLSPEAGWEPVMKRVNCMTGVALSQK